MRRYLLFNSCTPTTLQLSLVPKIEFVEAVKLDWTDIDLILISSYKKAWSLPFITQYTRFKGTVLATLPTIQFQKLLALELVHGTWDGQCPLFHLYDIEQSTKRMKSVFYNAPVKISNDLEITAFSNGVLLGGCNWTVSFGSAQILYIAESLKSVHPYCRSMDVANILNKDILITHPKLSQKPHISYNRSLLDLWPTIDNCLKNRGTILFPVQNGHDLFDLIEAIFNLLESSGVKRPIHLLSRTGKQAILQSSIFSEWMNEQRQKLAMHARYPLLVGALLEKRSLLCHDSVEKVLSYAEPRLVVCTRDIDHVSLYESLGNACVVLSDSSIKVPNQGVFYYDLAPKEEYNLKGIIELVKPRQVCIDKSEFSIAHDLDCSLPTDILSRPMKKGGYIPIQGTLDLMNNSIMLK